MASSVAQLRLNQDEMLGTQTADAVIVALYRPQCSRNFGAILRTVACSGFSRVIVIAPEPGWKFPWMLSEHAKKSMQNASKGVGVRVDYVTSADFLRTVHQSGFSKPIVCLETSERALSLHEYTFPRPHREDGGFYLLFGSEGYGVSDKNLLAAATDIVTIPMFGYNSLNLSASVAMTLFEVRRQWRVNE